MFSHIILGVRDLDRAGAFYDAVLAPLGWQRQVDQDDGGPAGRLWTVPGQPLPQFWVQLPWNGLPATWGNGTQVSFLASSQTAVDQAHLAGLRLGGVDEGAPGLRPGYGLTYYGAYLRDPDGNKICLAHGV